MLTKLLDEENKHIEFLKQVRAAADEAAKVKRRTYKELVNSRDLRLVVAASETGGRLHEEGEKLLWSAAAHRARSEPVRLRKAACRAFYARWCTLLSIAVQSALAATLVEEGVGLLDGVGGDAPPLAAVVCGEVGDFDSCISILGKFKRRFKSLGNLSNSYQCL